MYLGIVWIFCQAMWMLLLGPVAVQASGVNTGNAASYEDIMEKIKAGQFEDHEDIPTAVKSELEAVLENSKSLINVSNA